MRGIKRFNKKLAAFSLAEMLLVLLIMSFLSVAIAPFVTKKVKKDTLRQPHGRFECFWDGDRLVQYKVLESGTGVEEDRTATGYCEFEPAARATFYLVQGVGGGGGGAFAALAPNIKTFTAKYTDRDEANQTVDAGYYIPCSRLKNDSNQVRTEYYAACTGHIKDSFSDSSAPSETSSKWAWVNEIWNDPAYTPTRTYKICSGHGAGGWGVGAWVLVDDGVSGCVNPDGSANASPIFPESSDPADDLDPCYDYPDARGGQGGDGGCVEITVTLPLGSLVERGNLNYGFTVGYKDNGPDIYATYGIESCLVTGGKVGEDGEDSRANGSWVPGADGEDATLSVFNTTDTLDSVPYTCTGALTTGSVGGDGGDGGMWNPNALPWTLTYGGSNSNNSFEFSKSFVPISYEYKRAYNYYGMAGGAGEYNMMFFPEITQKIKIVPGKAGKGGTGTLDDQQGQAGGATTATFANETTPFLSLAGGRGSKTKMAGNYFNLYSQDPVYNNDTSMVTARIGEYSDFVAAISADEGTNLQSIIPDDAKPGRGGDGGYTVLRDTRNGGKRAFDGHDFTTAGDERFKYGGDALELPVNSAKEIVCHDHGPLLPEYRLKIAGEETYCPGEDGEDGAVIIIW